MNPSYKRNNCQVFEQDGVIVLRAFQSIKDFEDGELIQALIPLPINQDTLKTVLDFLDSKIDSTTLRFNLSQGISEILRSLKTD